MELSENSRIEEEKARAAVREKDSKINELTANLAASQKQVENYVDFISCFDCRLCVLIIMKTAGKSMVRR